MVLKLKLEKMELYFRAVKNSESIVKQTIDNFKAQGKTVIVIAHRLSTIANADTILVMENGQIVESGNHKDLLELKGKYSELWKKQSLV